MVKNHLKTLAAPKTWAIKRKSRVFVIKPAPGAHTLQDSVPLKFLLTDMLKYGRTSKEVKYILQNKHVLVDGKRRKSLKFGVGVMDSVQVPDLDEYYRIILNTRGKIDFVKISKEESERKICKIINKKSIGKTAQINLDDGKNILVDKDLYKVGDSLLLHLPDSKVIEHIKLCKGAAVYLRKGKHVGKVGTVEEINKTNIVFRSDGKVLHTMKDFAVVVGKDKPVITLVNK